MDTPATLVPVTAEGWTLFAAGADHWLRDLDLAERADLAKPRDIRTTIKGALEDGALTIAGTPSDGPQVRIERTVVAIGSGASREVDEYYLSEEAALLVVTRLRTRAAIALTRSIVRAFLAVVRGVRSGNLDEARRCMGAAYMLTRAPRAERQPRHRYQAPEPKPVDLAPIKARVLARIRRAGAAGLPGGLRGVREAVGGKNIHVDAALRELVTEGAASRRTDGLRVWYVAPAPAREMQ